MADTAVTLPFADGRYTFALPVARVFAIERTGEKRSIFTIYDDLAGGLVPNESEGFSYAFGGSARMDEIRAVIREGLIGGREGIVDGETIVIGQADAVRLIEGYCYPHRPAAEDAETALFILDAAIRGVQLKKKADPQPDPQSRSVRASS